MLKKGDKFTGFSLPDHKGERHSQDDYAGKWLVVYFYPKDNTSGCTQEAQDFSRLAGDFAARGAVVFGVSPDSVKSHSNFVQKKELSVTLLSDPEHDFLQNVGVWQKKKMCGREYMGVVRTTVIVDPEGTVREVWDKVKVAGHADEVLKRLVELQS